MLDGVELAEHERVVRFPATRGEGGAPAHRLRNRRLTPSLLRFKDAAILVRWIGRRPAIPKRKNRFERLAVDFQVSAERNVLFTCDMCKR